VAFAFSWLAALLMILAGWLAATRAGRLLRWPQSDAEVLDSRAYSMILGSGGRRYTTWGAAVTLRYGTNGQTLVTTVDRGFQSAIRPWMEHWARHYPVGSHRKIAFNPADPLEVDLHGEWSLTSFASAIEFALAAALFWWGSRRLRRVEH
jgi:hypothetical protein